MGRFRLREKFVIIIAITILVVSALFMVVFSHTQQEMMHNEMLEKARVMTREMEAVWEFVEVNQNKINYTKDGIYEFKGLYCSIVGKSVGKLFSRDSDYEFHYTSLSPRNIVDKPDAFEEEIMRYLAANSELEDYYEVTEYEVSPNQTKKVFRYVQELEAEQSCLRCHGGPAGEIDVTGYPKEGLEIGDVVGAISIVMPMDTLNANLQNSIEQTFFYFVLLMILISIVLYIAVSRLVISPLNRLQTAVNQMAEDPSDVQVEEIKGHSEVTELVHCFNKMARELDAMYEKLESQVEDRTAELREVNQVLESVNKSLREENRSKTDFLAVMTHELRTPLTSIMGFTELIMKMEGHEKREQELLERVHENSANLLTTINNTLDLFKLEVSEGELDLDWVEIVDVVGAVEKQMLPIFRKKNLTWCSQIDLDVELFVADADMIFHILENLLSNAAKFTPEGGLVELQVSHDREAKQVVMQVRDNGIGIAPEHLELIFEKFTQSDKSISRQYGGSGLGLTLVKKWAEIHGGTVSVESEPGKGSTFIVRLPSDLEKP